MKRSKFSVEEAPASRDLFGTSQVRFDGWSFGQWDGLTWRTLVSANGSFIEIGKTRWELVPHVSSSERDGARWHLRDRTGKRVTSLFMTPDCLFMIPDGDVGSRWELSIRYRSQRLWREKRLAWARATVIERLEGPVEFQWAANIPSTFRKSQSG
jgi:hypothetical protein